MAVFHDQAIVQRVRTERKKGTSIKKLGSQFGIPETSVSRWIRDIPSQVKIFNNARDKENSLKLELQELTSQLNVDENMARIFVGLLYWCEGSKYPANTGVAFANSDHRLVKTFLELLRKGFKIQESKIKIHLQLHSTHPQQKITKFWSTLLQIPLNQFYKPTITAPTRKRKRLNYKGTCTIKYFDVKLVLRIMGLYEGLANKYSNGEVPKRLKGGVC